MADWWIDEEPYPGPTYHPTFGELWYRQTSSFGKAWERIRSAFLRVHFGISTDEASDAMQAFLASFNNSGGEPRITSIDPTRGMTVRERALYLQQHRNTGPRSDWAFDRNGRKIR